MPIRQYHQKQIINDIFAFYASRRELNSGESVTRLGVAESNILAHLVENQGQVVSKEKLIDVGWPNSIVSNGSIHQTIKNLRKYFNDDQKQPTYIQTMPKAGYRFIATVSQPEMASNLPTKSPGKIGFRKLAVQLTLLVVLVGSLLTLVFVSNKKSDVIYPERIEPITSIKGQSMYPSDDPLGEYLLFSHRPNAAGSWNLYAKSIHRESYISLTNNDARDSFASFSPDGSKILFHRYQDNTCQMMLGDFDRESVSIKNISPVLTCYSKLQSMDSAWQDNDNVFLAYKGSEKDSFQIVSFNIKSKKLEKITESIYQGEGDYLVSYSQELGLLSFVRDVAWSKYEIWTYSVLTKELKKIDSLPIIQFGIDWVDNGQAIAYRKGVNQIKLHYPKRSDKSLKVLLNFPIYSPFSFNKSEIGFMDGSLYVKDVAMMSLENSSGEYELVANSSFNDYMPAVAHYPDSIFFLSNRSGLPQVWRKGSGDELHQITNYQTQQDISSLMVSPDGKYVAALLFTGIYVYGLDGEVVYQSMVTDEVNINPVFSKDSKSLMFATNTTGHWQVEKINLMSKHREVVEKNAIMAKDCLLEDCLLVVRPHSNKIEKVSSDGRVSLVWASSSNINYTEQWHPADEGVLVAESANNEVNGYFVNLDGEVVREAGLLKTKLFSFKPSTKQIVFSLNSPAETNFSKLLLSN